MISFKISIKGKFDFFQAFYRNLKFYILFKYKQISHIPVSQSFYWCFFFQGYIIINIKMHRIEVCDLSFRHISKKGGYTIRVFFRCVLTHIFWMGVPIPFFDFIGKSSNLSCSAIDFIRIQSVMFDFLPVFLSYFILWVLTFVKIDRS